MNKKEKKIYYLEYSALFLLIAGMIVFYFYSSGKTMISEGGDGFRQHYRALLYYSDYLKSIFKGFMKGDFSIPQWDFAIGEGADALLTLHLHAIGDIFAFFSFLCPDKYMYLYYDGITIARMYCSGLFFSMLCLYTGKKKRYAVLTGALLYAFCSFSIFSMYNHVYFISAAVYLPLILLGVEKIIKGDNPYLLTISVAISALSNFYFFFMNVVSTVIYVAVRLIYIKTELKARASILLRIGVYSVLGVLIGSVIFLPMLKTMLNNSRMNAPVQFAPLFDVSTYRTYFTRMTFQGVYFGGFSFLWILAFSHLFFIRKDPTLITLLIVLLLFANVPFLSSIYHAFTYPTDRWQYALSLLVAYITAGSLEDLEGVDKILPINIVLSLLYYGACIYLDADSKMLHILFFAMTVAFVLFIRFVRFDSLRRIASVASVVFFMALQAFYLFGPNYWCYPRQSVSIEDVSEMTTGEYSVFDEISDDSFFRYSGSDLIENANIHGDRSSTQHYWSIVNNNIVDFRKQLAYSDSSLHHLNDYGERFTQNALSGVKYYINHSENDPVPYGFTFLDTINGLKVYQSKYSLPLIYGYDNYISEESWAKLDSVEKNETLAQAAVVKEQTNISEIQKADLDNEKIPYTMTTGNDIDVDQDSIKVTGNDAFIYLDAAHQEKGEYYVSIKGLYSNIMTAVIDVKYEDINRSFVFKGTDNQHYTDRHDYIINLGHLDGINGTISLDFSGGGEYTYDSIDLVCQPLEHQIEYLNKLRNIDVEMLEIKDDLIDARIDIPENKLICFSIPFSEGWKAYVDGEETELLNCNIQYMGLELAKGKHTIELKYSTPLLKEGTMLSLAAGAILLALVLKERRNIKANHVDKA
nr:YfhO family protein [Clostridia bacterium]